MSSIAYEDMCRYDKGAYIKYVGGGRRILQIFQEKFRSPGDHRTKYFMAQ